MCKLSTFTLGLLLCTLWLVSCSLASEGGDTQLKPVGWETALPDEISIDQEKLSDLVNRVSNGDFQNIHGILIVKDGRLVFEQYFPGHAWDWDADQFQGEFTEFDAQTLHSVMSVSKVFTSALTGIALESGFIEDLDQPVISYFPYYSHLSNSQKNEIT
ncbi:MAG: serine hydrolase, partial [Chloroflexota bacterium]